jgi:hypothetical protein
MSERRLAHRASRIGGDPCPNRRGRRRPRAPPWSSGATAIAGAIALPFERFACARSTGSPSWTDHTVGGDVRVFTSSDPALPAGIRSRADGAGGISTTNAHAGPGRPGELHLEQWAADMPREHLLDAHGREATSSSWRRFEAQLAGARLHA